MNFTKKDYDKLKELQIESNLKGSNKELFTLGLSAMALGGLAIPFASVPIGIGALALGGLTAMASFIKKDDMAITEDMPLYSELVPKEDIFEHTNIANVYGEKPKFTEIDMIDKTITFVYDVPFGLIDEDFEESKSRIAKLLGCDDVELEFKDNKLYIKHKKKAQFKDFYTYKPIYLPKSMNFNILIGMVEDNGEIVPYHFDFAEEPHMLLAGVNGKGKSTILNVLIINLLINYTPQELQMYLIDFKGGVEFNCFDNVKHVKEVIWKKDRFAKLLKWLEDKECPRREDLLRNKGSKNIFGYNENVVDSGKLPFILVVLDEFAQLSPTDDKEIIDQLIRLISKTRFVGIYFILSTQRPSANILTNDIKTNLTNIVGLGVRDMHDTKCIFGDHDVELHKVKGKGKGYFRHFGEYKYFNGFYLGVNPSDRSEQERTIKKLLTEYDLYK